MSTISVIVPVYKVEKYLNRCIDSILAQTFTDFELILVDDGSPDNCGAICDEYASRDSRTHVIHQKNGGRSAARNAGLNYVLANSDSEWITFVDSDDWIHPNCLQWFLEGCLTHNVKLCFGRWSAEKSYCQNETVEEKPLITKMPIKEAYLSDGNGGGDYVWSRLYHKSLWTDFRFPNGKNFEDIHTVPYVIFQEKYASVVDAVTYYYFTNPEGIVNSSWNIGKIEAFNAREAEIAFFEKMGFSELCRMHSIGYLAFLVDHINELTKTSERHDESLRVLKAKRKKAWKFMRYLDLRDNSDAYVATKAFPIRMWFYWHIRAIKNRIHV